MLLSSEYLEDIEEFVCDRWKIIISLLDSVEFVELVETYHSQVKITNRTQEVLLLWNAKINVKSIKSFDWFPLEIESQEETKKRFLLMVEAGGNYLVQELGHLNEKKLVSIPFLFLSSSVFMALIHCANLLSLSRISDPYESAIEAINLYIHSKEMPFAIDLIKSRFRLKH